MILDPSTHGIARREDYTRWDLDAVRKCQVVLAFMEDSNPGGYNLALEVGYAHALEKPIFFVNDLKPDRSRHFDMIRAVASRHFGTLEDALNALSEYGKMGAMETGSRGFPSY
jgi:nucleoside 2-deoxyribosyltransferase